MRCLIVAGPESAGNRLLASILVRAGCAGSGSTDQPRCAAEVPPADNAVWIMHHQLARHAQELHALGWQVEVLIVVREWTANVGSLVQRGHDQFRRAAGQRILTTLADNLHDILVRHIPCRVLTYEGLTEGSIRALLLDLGLRADNLGEPLRLDGQIAPCQPEPLLANAKHYPCESRTGADLLYSDYCFDRGALRQVRLEVTQTYDRDYLASRYVGIDERVRALSARRLHVLEAFAPRGSLLDFGCGTGRFVEAALASGWDAWGHDLVTGEGPRLSLEEARQQPWDVATFFDSLEHLPDPGSTIRALNPGWLLVSVPECHYPGAEQWFMTWKHRRPGEHLWHWSRSGLVTWLAALGYRCLMTSSFEDEFRPSGVADGLSNILSGVFVREPAPRASPAP
jgi:hypothetical protein